MFMPFLFSSAFAYSSPILHLYTIENPPSVIKKGDGVRGLGGNFGLVVSAAILKSGKEKDFAVTWVPWKRALIELDRNKNALFFPFTRTEDREERFSWVMHLADYDCLLYAINPSVQLNSFQDLKRYRVGVLAGSAREAELRKYMGATNPNVEGLTEDISNYRKLESGRIDIWATQPVVLGEAQKIHISRGGKNPLVRIVKKLMSQSLWIAGNKEMSAKEKALVQSIFGPEDKSKSLLKIPAHK